MKILFLFFSLTFVSPIVYIFIITLVTLAIIGPLLAQNHSPPSLLCFSFEKWLESQVTWKNGALSLLRVKCILSQWVQTWQPSKGTDSKDSLQLERKLLFQLLNDLHEESTMLNRDSLVFLEFLLGSLTSIISWKGLQFPWVQHLVKKEDSWFVCDSLFVLLSLFFSFFLFLF